MAVFANGSCNHTVGGLSRALRKKKPARDWHAKENERVQDAAGLGGLRGSRETERGVSNKGTASQVT